MTSDGAIFAGTLLALAALVAVVCGLLVALGAS